MGARLCLEGLVFGRLTVLKIRPEIKNRSGQISWVCRCSCGKLVTVAGVSLKHGRTKSCGCLQKEAIAATGHKHFKHGSTPKRLYHTWNTIKGRVLRESSPDYPDYGGRGIKICKEWENDYHAFKLWAINNGYSEKLTIDRIDNNGDYSPGNCQWATNYVQSRNKRSNVLYTHPETKETLCATDWGKRLGVLGDSIKSRVKRGWSLADALSLPKYSKVVTS